MSNSQLTHEVMIRVRFIHLMKRVLKPFAIEAAVFSTALLAVGRGVFVARVFENAPPVEKFDQTLSFFGNAFMNTESSVQLLILAVAVAGALALKDTIQALKILPRLSTRYA